MKMKEKKTEEVAEEVVETPKISNELVEYLAFARYCKSQMCQFFNEIEDRNVIQTVKDSELERFGIDTSLPIGINVGFSKENMLKLFEEFVEEWVKAYNKLDLLKYDNYTNVVLKEFAPDPSTISCVRSRIKEKCAQHTTGE